MPKRAAKQYAIFTAKVDLQQTVSNIYWKCGFAVKQQRCKSTFAVKTVCNYENELAANALLQ